MTAEYQARILAAISEDNVSENGIAFEYVYDGAEGTTLLLLLEAHHSYEDVKAASHELRRDTDCKEIDMTLGLTL